MHVVVDPLLQLSMRTRLCKRPLQVDFLNETSVLALPQDFRDKTRTL